METYKDYIATWFYREAGEEAGYYPQAGGRGDSALLHSVYMRIQVPFFTTFRYYNPQAGLLFFTNLEAGQLPPFLTGLFQRTGTEIVTLPYRNSPPHTMVQGLEKPVLRVRHIRRNGATHAAR